MKVELTILVENTTPIAGIGGEYGFAVLVRLDEKSWLFDTGLGGCLLPNAQRLKVDLSALEGLIVSHGHFDHTGAVEAVLKLRPGLKIYAHPEVFLKRYTVAGERRKDISARFTAQTVAENGGEMVFKDNYCEIAPGLWLSGAIPRRNAWEDTGGNFWAETADGLVPDLLADDIALVIDHAEGLIILSGCAHSGMINIIEHVMAQSGRQKIRAFIGGLHLNAASPERLSQTIAYLSQLDIELLVPCHCTGFAATAALYQALGPEKVIKGESAMKFTFS